MLEESLEDDNFEVFKGGTLEIKVPEEPRAQASANLLKTEAEDNELNANIDKSGTSVWKGSNLIDIPKRISETLWSCKNNNEVSKSREVLPVTVPDPGINANDYFTFRDGVVEHAAQDCIEQILEPDIDGEVVSTFLLTEITLWDTEKERLIILTTRSVLSIKYDFIALKRLEYKRIHLESLDSLIQGDIVYPATSLVPRLNGLASGVTDVMKGCLLERWSKNDQRFLNSNLFQPRDRKVGGVRLQWNKGEPIGFTQRWNPFSNDAPMITFISHPLQQFLENNSETTGTQPAIFSVDEFVRQLIISIEHLQDHCIIHHKDIMIQAYLGIGSLIYNRNSLGFFKVRGKFSF